jgi:hypothetical protein
MIDEFEELEGFGELMKNAKKEDIDNPTTRTCQIDDPECETCSG